MKVHISLNVNNVENSVNFYQKMLGIKPMKFITGKTAKDNLSETEKPKMGYAKFNVANPPLNLTLNEVDFETGGSLSHLGLQVESTEDVLKMRQKWIDEGLITADEMGVDCCYAKQDKTWVQDPDGNEWEAFVVLENTEDKINLEEDTTNSCCNGTEEKVKIESVAQKSCC